MKKSTSAFVVAYVIGAGLVAAPTPTLAQTVPDAGQVAAGIDLGLFLPTDERLDTSVTAGGFFEMYLSPRISVRTGVMAMRPGYQGTDDDQERQARIGVDGIYNWEYGRIHPFAGGGLGVHILRTSSNGENVGTNHNEVGLSALGGFEYFVNTEWSVKTEGRYQWVGDIPFVDPGGFAITVGVKRYF